MQLKSAHVTNFRSAEDSGEFEIDDITCLVGKNEAGKTAVLQALAGLNPHPATPFEFNKERDYPRRHLTKYGTRHGGQEAVVITTKWQISESQKEKIFASFGADSLTGELVTISKRYNQEKPEWGLPVNFRAAVTHILSHSNLSAPEKSQIKDAGNTRELVAALSAIASPTEKHRAILEKINTFPGKNISGKIKDILSEGFPRFMYFSTYDRMSGEVQLQTLQEQKAEGALDVDEKLSGDRLFYEFLEYAGAPLEEILSATTYESFTARLQAASNSITDQILEYWSQNPDISVNVEVDAAKPGDLPPFNTGTIGRARIYNQLHRVDVPFGERSAGFIWFFSFLIKFARVKEDQIPVILLLDEPGLTLHGKAQGDLLRYFEEKLAPYHQIIYSTHSPFMVPPDKLTSARIVEDLVDVNTSGRRMPIGTKVREDVLNTDPDSIFPLQGALGYEITQTLFVGKHTLLVEGPSDILYLKALSSALAARNRNSLNPHWTLCPSGGIGNIRPFVSLFKGNDLNIVVLTDFVRGDKRKIEDLRNSNVLRAGAVLTIDQFVSKVEADVEDIFEPVLFVELLNQVYSLSGNNALTVDKLEAADETTPRFVKKAEAYFRTLPPSIPMFDHYRPAEWLIENPKFLSGDRQGIEKTLDRMESIVDAVNPLLK